MEEQTRQVGPGLTWLASHLTVPSAPRSQFTDIHDRLCQVGGDRRQVHPSSVGQLQTKVDCWVEHLADIA